MISRFKSLTTGSQGTVIERRVRYDGSTVEISSPSLDFWVLDYVRNRLKSGAFLTLEAVPHNEEDEQE
jgi:hypothetical protein